MFPGDCGSGSKSLAYIVWVCPDGIYRICWASRLRRHWCRSCRISCCTVVKLNVCCCCFCGFTLEQSALLWPHHFTCLLVVFSSLRQMACHLHWICSRSACNCRKTPSITQHTCKYSISTTHSINLVAFGIVFSSVQFQCLCHQALPPWQWWYVVHRWIVYWGLREFICVRANQHLYVHYYVDESRGRSQRRLLLDFTSFHLHITSEPRTTWSRTNGFIDALCVSVFNVIGMCVYMFGICVSFNGESVRP